MAVPQWSKAAISLVDGRRKIVLQCIPSREGSLLLAIAVTAHGTDRPATVIDPLNSDITGMVSKKESSLRFPKLSRNFSALC